MEIFTIMFLIILYVFLITGQYSFSKSDRIIFTKLIEKNNPKNKDFLCKLIANKKKLSNIFLSLEVFLFVLLFTFVYLFYGNEAVVFSNNVVLILITLGFIQILSNWITSINPERIFYYIAVFFLCSKKKSLENKIEDYHELFTVEDISLILSIDNMKIDLDKQRIEKLLETVQREKLTIKNIMKVHRTCIIGIHAEETLEEAYEKISKYDYTFFPVYKDGLDDIKFVISRSEFLEIYIENDKSSKISDYNNNKTINTIVAAITVEDFLKKCKEKDAYFWVVRDEYGGTAGIITITDVLDLS